MTTIFESNMRTVQFREALNEAMSEEMRRDPNVFLMGEEVAEYDGAYKVSKGMLAEFGEKRVIDTPIAELGFTAIGVGAAMNGLRPIIEYMTWNFAVLASDQIINHAAKMLQMSGGQFNIPIVFRGGNGSAGQLAATHSQSYEAFYSNIPGLKVITPSNPYDAKGLLKAAIRDNDPVLFMESERMYGEKGDIPDGEYLLPIGVANVVREGKDVTIVSFGKMMKIALGAAEELAKEGIDAEVIDLRTIRPWDKATVLTSVKKTKHVITIEEAQINGGLGGAVSELLGEHLPVPIIRMGVKDVFGQSGTTEELLQHYGLTYKHVMRAAHEIMER